MDILKICGTAILSVVLSQVLKTNRYALGEYITIISGVVIMIFTLTSLTPLISYIKQLGEAASIGNNVIELLLKCSGIALLCQDVSWICSELGEKSLSSIVDIAGNVTITVLILPFIKDFIEEIIGLIK